MEQGQAYALYFIFFLLCQRFDNPQRVRPIIQQAE